MANLTPQKLSPLEAFFAPVIKACANFATEQRGWFVIFFVLPFSLLFDVYFSIRAKLVLYLYSAPELHEQRVKDIQRQIRSFNENNTGKKRKLCTSRGGWQSISPSLRPYKDKAKGININLYDILEFDEERQTVRVEPMVNMGQISHFLIPRGYTIPVLPELDDLTCGGLLMGVGIETSSHKYGLFNDAVIEAEIVTATGEVVKCSKTMNRKLFDALPWSYGTLGFLTSMTIRVIKCKPYVKMWYIPTYSAKESSQLFKAAALRKTTGIDDWENIKSKEDYDYFIDSANQMEFDFVESLMYSRDKMVTMPAKWVSKKSVESSKLNSIGLWYKPWFFKHVESFFQEIPARDDASIVESMRNESDIEDYLDDNFKYEYIPLRDYYHRHTKSIFWELEEIIPFGNHPIVRYLLGWALPPKVSFLKLTQTQKIKELYEKSHCIQDMMVPDKAMDSSLDVFEKCYGIYPLWICPYRAYDYEKLSQECEEQKVPHRYFLRQPETVIPGDCYELFVDLGAYGVPRAVKEKKEFDVVEVSREVEQFVYSVHGFQMLYATSYQDGEEFRAMFDHRFYDEMKSEYDPKDRFPQIYDKVCKKAMKMWESEYSATKKQQ